MHIKNGLSLSPFPATCIFRSFINRPSLLIFLFCISMGLLAPVQAQTLLPATSNTETTNSATTAKMSSALESPEAVRAMVARLSDQEVRDLLLKQLDSQVQTMPAATEQPSLLDFIKDSFSGVWHSIHTALIRLPLIPEGFAISFSTFFELHEPSGMLHIFGILLSGILVASAAVWLMRYLTRHWQATIEKPPVTNAPLERLELLSKRLALDILALAIFYIITYLINHNLQTAQAQELVHMIMLYVVIIPLFFNSFSRFLLAPKRPELRLLHADNKSAKALYKHQFILFILLGLNMVMIPFFVMHGVPAGETRLGFWTNMGLHLYIIYIAWSCRAGWISMMMGSDQDTLSEKERSLIRYYPWVIMMTSVMTWLVVEILVSRERFDLVANSPHYVTLVLVMFAPTFNAIVLGLVDHLTPPMTGDGLIAQKAYLSTKRACIRIGRVLMVSLAIFLLAGVWGIDFHDIASGGFGAQAATNLFAMLMVIAVGYICWELVTLWINRKLAAEQTAAGLDLTQEEPAGGEGGGAGSSRLSTILPLLRLVLQSVIVVMTTLTALGSLGIDTTPLLAGAGIAGIAIGFGAQKLVTDVVSGIFFLVDDAFRAGEYVMIDDTVGTVEKISMRSMQLRHHRGAIHTIPYGEIPKITNYSRDWVIVKLPFTVPFDTDLQKVKKIFKQIGKELLLIPEYRDDFLQPFKSQGVMEVNDVGIVIRGKFMAKPGKQFVLSKEIYQRVQMAFDNNGLQFARKEVRVKLDGAEPDELSKAEKMHVTAAAVEISEPVETHHDKNTHK